MTPDRPRDRLGRPLPHDADPERVAPGIPDVDDLSDDQVWQLGVDYLARGMPFHAHEVFEMRWRTASPAARDAWRGLAQWGAALTHRARGNTVGSRALAARTLDTLSGAGHVPPCVDLPRIEATCREILGESGAVGGAGSDEPKGAP